MPGYAECHGHWATSVPSSTPPALAALVKRSITGDLSRTAEKHGGVVYIGILAAVAVAFLLLGMLLQWYLARRRAKKG